MNAAPSVWFPGDAVKPHLDYRSEWAEVEGRADSAAEAEMVSRLSVGRIGFDVVGARAGDQVGLGSASRGGDDEIAPYSPYSQVGVLDFCRATGWGCEAPAEGLVHPIEPEPDR